jgi:phosphate-selective porin OprO/OprP
MHSIMPTRSVAAFLALAPVSSALAAEAPSDPMKDSFDQAWSLVKLYENPDHPVIQKLVFTGRLQLDYAIVDGEGSPAAGVNEDISYDFGGWRRLRAGFKGTVFKDFTLHAEADFDPDEAPVYRRLTDAYIGWAPSQAFELKLGKQGMGFTLDGKTSSKELLTIDRNNLSNNLWFTTEYLPGLTVGGEIEDWSYHVGVFSQGDEDGEFGNFDAGTTWLASVAYDFSKALSVDKALLALDYVYNEENPGRGLFANRALGHVLSLNFSYEDGPYGFRSDLVTGDGQLGQSDIWGLVAMPYYHFSDKLQAVFRYTYLTSDDADGIRFSRYETFPLRGNRGDEYHEAYLGLNYLLYGHKLKLQTGIQYVSMDDRANSGGEFDGWGWTTGLRLSW